MAATTMAPRTQAGRFCTAGSESKQRSVRLDTESCWQAQAKTAIVGQAVSWLILLKTLLCILLMMMVLLPTLLLWLLPLGTTNNAANVRSAHRQ